MEITEKLESLSKKELTAIIERLIADGKITENDVIYPEEKISLEESNILTKLKNKIDLTAEEEKYLREKLDKKKNVQIISIIKGKSFLSEIVKFKIDFYFNLCWKIYPKKVGKDLALKSFYKLYEKTKLDDIDVLSKYIYKRVQTYTNYVIESKTESQFIMHFSTFCNSKKYL